MPPTLTITGKFTGPNRSNGSWKSLKIFLWLCSRHPRRQRPSVQPVTSSLPGWLESCSAELVGTESHQRQQLLQPFRQRLGIVRPQGEVADLATRALGLAVGVVMHPGDH